MDRFPLHSLWITKDKKIVQVIGYNHAHKKLWVTGDINKQLDPEELIERIYAKEEKQH